MKLIKLCCNRPIKRRIQILWLSALIIIIAIPLILDFKFASIFSAVFLMSYSLIFILSTLRQRSHELYLAILQLNSVLDELKIANNELEHLSSHDSLTQLPNRQYFLKELKRVSSQAYRRNSKRQNNRFEFGALYFLSSFTNLWVLGISFIFFGIAFIFMQTSHISTAQEKMPTMRGTAMSLASFNMFVDGAAGTAVNGFIMKECIYENSWNNKY